jgi:hypothetical protein
MTIERMNARKNIGRSIHSVTQRKDVTFIMRGTNIMGKKHAIVLI